jgi:hypothetical protein
MGVVSGCLCCDVLCRHLALGQSVSSLCVMSVPDLIVNRNRPEYLG